MNDELEITELIEEDLTEVTDEESSNRAILKSARNSPFRVFANMSRGKIGKTLLFSLILAAFTAILYKATREDANEIEFPHDGREFTVEGMSLRDKIAQLFHGSSYSHRTFDLADRALNHRKLKLGSFMDFSDWLLDFLKSNETIGGLHLFRSDARTLDETNRTAIETMAKSKIPPFITMDIVGGYTNHIGLTQKEVEEYGVPEEFLEIAKKGGTVLPSQEALGKAFDKLVYDRDYEGQIQFRKQMEDYGKAIAKMCRDIGIVLNFSPVLDTVENTEGDQFMEKNDETYGSSVHTVMVLGFHYMKGFQKVPGVMIAPKHFAGTGKMPSNPHKTEDIGISTMNVTDGSILPFKDAIQGTLFSDSVAIDYSLDYKIWSLKHRIKNLKIALRGRSKKSRGYRSRQNELGMLEQVLKNLCEKYDISRQLTSMPPVNGVMVGHAQNFMNPKTPGSLSPEIINRRLRRMLGFKGIAWTDDLSMGAIDFHLENGNNENSNDSGVNKSDATTASKNSLSDTPADRFVKALIAGATVPMILHRTGHLDNIAERVKRAIEEGEDFNGDGKPDLTMQMINERVRMVIDQKAQLGLLLRARKKDANTVYINNSKRYMSRTRAFRHR